MIERCDLNRPPPVARTPVLPAPLPKTRLTKLNNDRSCHKYPAAPAGARVGTALVKKLGLNLSSYDYICGTSFIYALAGDSRYMKDDFYLEWCEETCCVLHIPSHKHSQDTVGHAVESPWIVVKFVFCKLCCGTLP